MAVFDIQIKINWKVGEYKTTIISLQDTFINFDQMMQKIMEEIEYTDDIPFLEDNILKVSINISKANNTSDFRILRISGDKTV